MEPGSDSVAELRRWCEEDGTLVEESCSSRCSGELGPPVEWECSFSVPGIGTALGILVRNIRNLSDCLEGLGPPPKS